MTLRLYDTARGAVVDFDPPEVVRMYVCGITPYDATHLGHAATYITYDVLQRRLRDSGHQTRCVRNITDVDDDILAAARRRGVHYLDLAFGETARFDDDMAALNTLPPASEPRATSAIPDIRGFIHAALQRGFAYRSGGSVYFDTQAFDGFGSLSGFGRDHMIELARQWRDDPDDPAKRDPLDFVLWQGARSGEPSWESRWGPGRPGWHVECSTLALRELGETIDLHGRGSGPAVPAPRMRAGPVRGGDGQAVRPTVASPSAGSLPGRQDVEVARQPGVRPRTAPASRADGHPTGPDVPALPHPLALARRPAARGRANAWPYGGNASTGGDADADLLDEVRQRLDDDLDVPGALAAVDDAARAGHTVRAAADLLGVASERARCSGLPAPGSARPLGRTSRGSRAQGAAVASESMSVHLGVVA